MFLCLGIFSHTVSNISSNHDGQIMLSLISCFLRTHYKTKISTCKVCLNWWWLGGGGGGGGSYMNKQHLM